MQLLPIVIILFDVSVYIINNTVRGMTLIIIFCLPLITPTIPLATRKLNFTTHKSYLIFLLHPKLYSCGWIFHHQLKPKVHAELHSRSAKWHSQATTAQTSETVKVTRRPLNPLKRECESTFISNAPWYPIEHCFVWRFADFFGLSFC